MTLNQKLKFFPTFKRDGLQEALRQKSDELPQEIQKIETKIAQAEMEYSMMAGRYKQHIKM